MNAAYERRLCNYLENRLNVELPKTLGAIVDDAMVHFPRASAEELASTLAKAVKEGGEAGVAARVRGVSIAARAERLP